MAQQKSKLLFSLSILFCLQKSTAAAADEASLSHVVETLPGYPGLLPFKLETGSVFLTLYFLFCHTNRSIIVYIPKQDFSPNHLDFWVSPLSLDTNRLIVVCVCVYIYIYIYIFAGILGLEKMKMCSYFITSLSRKEIRRMTRFFSGTLADPVALGYLLLFMKSAASIIFIDAPVGTGFSYANRSRSYYTSDTKSTTDRYMFLTKWLLIHPSFLKNCLYVGGDSYGGKIAPMVAFEIAKGKEAGFQPRMNFHGYLIGNPIMERDKDPNERVAYAHRMALISDEYYELAKSSCNGEYVNPDPTNIQCLYALRLIKECTKNIFDEHILEPVCELSSPRRDDIRWGQTFVEDVPDDFLFLSKEQEPWCRVTGYFNFYCLISDYSIISYEFKSFFFSYSQNLSWLQKKNCWPSYIWAIDKSVQKALHVREGTKEEEWMRCKRILPYEMDVRSVLKYHVLLNQKGYQILVYSGDHDFGLPYMSTLKWIRSLNLTVEDEWRPWTIDGQVAGYAQKYKNKEAYITFATVKGAGHTAPEYMPKQCFAMAYRWLSLYPL